MSIPQSGGGPIERDSQLAEYLSNGCKPANDWRIGTEHEKFGYCKDTLNPLPYDGPRSIKAMLEGLRDRFGWSEIQEAGHIIGLQKDGANVSLEPGGQLELSGAPLETIHQTCDEVNVHLKEVQAVACSPFFEGKPNGYQSWRGRIWQSLDDDRTGMLPFVFEEGMGFERYVDYALDVPMYFVYRDGTYINALGQSFRDFLKGELPALPGEVPTLSDWADHLTTIFPETRIKQFMEMRGADGGPWRRICALPAFWVGLLYDASSLDAAWDICKDWTAQERDQLRIDAAKDGLKAKIRGRPECSS